MTETVVSDARLEQALIALHTVVEALGNNPEYNVPPLFVHTIQKSVETLRLRATPPAPERKEVGVKSLEWFDLDGKHRIASVSQTNACNMKYEIYMHQGTFEPVWSGSTGESFGTLEAAKAAAQADYEQRIRSALASPVPLPVTVTPEMLRAGVTAAMAHDGMKLKFQVEAILKAALSKPGEQG